MRICDGVGYRGTIDIDLEKKELHMLVIRRTGQSDEERNESHRKVHKL